MVQCLVVYIPYRPAGLPLTERDDAVLVLPVEAISRPDFMIHKVCSTSFDLADERRKRELRRHRGGQVHVVPDTANGMDDPLMAYLSST
jgi:hypothetical protein